MELTVGAILDGKVKSLTKFGAFITLPNNAVGMVHISEVAHAYVNDIHDYLAEGQDVKVMVIGLDAGKINLSIKRTLPAPAKPQYSRPRPQFDRQQSGAPARGGSGGFSGGPAPAPQGKSFDDMLKQFMTESDSKMSSIKQYSEHRTKTRKR